MAAAAFVYGARRAARQRLVARLLGRAIAGPSKGARQRADLWLHRRWHSRPRCCPVRLALLRIRSES